MAKDTAKAPTLPPASVDFNALHEACKAGAKPADALDRAVIAPAAAEAPVEEAKAKPAKNTAEPAA